MNSQVLNSLRRERGTARFLATGIIVAAVLATGCATTKPGTSPATRTTPSPTPIALPTPSVGPPSTPSTSPTIAGMPVSSMNFYDSGLYSVSCISPTDCWAVGDSHATSTANPQPLAEHYDGRTWLVVATPKESVGGSLSGVSCATSADCWAVGDYWPGNGSSAPLLEHWDGSAWTRQVVPSTISGHAQFLKGVDCLTSTDCWAVGYTETASPPAPTLPKKLIEHYDGTGWRSVPSPSVKQYDELTGIDCDDSSHCWAVGFSSSDSGVLWTLIESYDGSSWRVVTSPNPSSWTAALKNSLRDIACTSARDCWTVGSYSDAMGADRMLVAHYDGTRWTQVSSPSPGIGGDLFGVTCPSSLACWAVGSQDAPTGRPLMLTYTATGWQTFVPPTSVAAAVGGTLRGIACARPKACLVVGVKPNPSREGSSQISEEIFAPSAGK